MTSEQAINNPPSVEQLLSHLTSYNNFELLATGGMGTVYKATQVTLDRPVAIKLLTHPSATNQKFREIFEYEARVMAKLNHTSLISIYDYGEVERIPYIVMQFINGRTLHQAAHGKTVIPRESAILISKISKALATAHSSGILHRDIKPANILIDSSINPVVVDFGLAQYLDDPAMRSAGIFGTRGYTAPEVLTPPYHSDQRADIFSLGVLFHELLTGQIPQSPYLEPSSIVKVDPRYDRVVMRAIHPDRNLRYPNATALASDLDKIIAGKELTASSLLLTPVNNSELRKTI